MPSEVKKLIYDAGTRIETLLGGKIPEKINSADYTDTIEIAFSEIINELINSFSEAREFTLALANGELKASPPSKKNILSSPFKQLHAQLKHLTWQTERIAAGDYSQRVDFMGNFSKAFNSMVIQLADRENDLRQARDELEMKVQQRTAELTKEIAERKKAEQESRLKSQQWQDTFNAIAEPILLLDTNAVILQCNDATLKLLGKSSEEIIGRPCYELMHRTFGPIEGCPFKRMMQSKHRESTVFEKGERHFESVVDPIFDDSGNIASVVHILIDITESVKSAETLRNLNKELRATVEKLTIANRELGDFAYVAAHDLKAPLRSIGTIADWLSTDYADSLDEQGKKQLELLTSRVQRMNTHISSLLRYSELGHTSVQKQRVNLQILIEEAISEIPSSQNVEITISNSLPVIMCYEDIKEVFKNLLDNAIKFMDKPKARIKIDCIEQENFWQFSITDNGPGIESRYFEKIFRMFQTLKPRDEFEATGIGLAVVKKVIEMNQGRLWVESQPGQGSTFFFTLPKEGFEVENAEYTATITC
jgi:two-component system sensor kinase FixL